MSKPNLIAQMVFLAVADDEPCDGTYTSNNGRSLAHVVYDQRYCFTRKELEKLLGETWDAAKEHSIYIGLQHDGSSLAEEYKSPDRSTFIQQLIGKP
jgi:hypothetical protein